MQVSRGPQLHPWIASNQPPDGPNAHDEATGRLTLTTPQGLRFSCSLDRDDDHGAFAAYGAYKPVKDFLPVRSDPCPCSAEAMSITRRTADRWWHWPPHVRHATCVVQRRTSILLVTAETHSCNRTYDPTEEGCASARRAQRAVTIARPSRVWREPSVQVNESRRRRRPRWRAWAQLRRRAGAAARIL